jgi:hypothetical protein
MAYPHWTMFEVIDEDLQEFSRQVEFAKPNFPTYSVTLVRLYLSICSEVDVVAKLLCQGIGAPNASNIDEYRESLKPKYPNLATLSIFLRPMPDIELTPWDSWNNTPPANLNPTWWTEHNKVKHERNAHFEKANLGNVLSAAAGLFVLLIYLHKPELYDTGYLQPKFRIFVADPKYVIDYTGGLGFKYALPDFGPS